MRRLNISNTLIVLVLLSGFTLSLLQFISNRSLWFDEAMLALNILNRNSLELLKPLDYNQIAPVLFLQIEKGFSIMIPDSELGLRLFPLISFWLSLFIFYKILCILFDKIYTVLFSLSLFAFNVNLIYYSSEVKQYMSDVFVLLIVYYLILKKFENTDNKYLTLGITGIIVVFISNATPIILLCGGIYLFYEDIHKLLVESKIKFLVLTYSLWITGFTIYYGFFIRDHPTHTYMINYWTKAKAFFPVKSLYADFYEFLLSKSKMVFGTLFPFGIGEILFVLFILGIIILFIRRRISLIFLMLLPLIVHLALSAFKIYPFDLRFILYASPVLIIVMATSFDKITNFIISQFKIEKSRLLVVWIPISLFILFYQSGFPILNQEIKKSITFIQNNIKREDKVYVHPKAVAAFKYYDQIHFTNISTPVLYCSLNKDNNDKMLELSKLTGNSWILFSHVSNKEVKFILSQLDEMGKNRIKTFKTVGSSTYLYDMGE